MGASDFTLKLKRIEANICLLSDLAISQMAPSYIK